MAAGQNYSTDPNVARKRGTEPTKSIKLLTAADSPYAVLAEDDYYLADCSGGPITITIPKVQALKNAYLQRTLLLKKIDSTGNPAAFMAQGTDLIDGSGALVITTPYQSRTIVNDLTSTLANWWIV